MTCLAKVHAVLVLERDPASPAAAGRARDEHERVADQPADGMAVAAGDRGRHEAVSRALEQRNLGAGRSAQRVRVAVAPVLVDERPPAQVADAAAAAPQEVRERARLRQPREPGAEHVHRLLERRAHVRRAERDAVLDESRPVRVGLRRVTAGAARHQAAHGMPHERDLIDVHGPDGQEPLHQLAQRAAVLRDVAAAVVADVDRRAADLAREAVAEPLATAERPRELGRHQPVDEDDDAPRRGRKGRGDGLGLERDGLAGHAHGHRLRERAPLLLERVAAKAGYGGDHGTAVRRARQRQALAPGGGATRRHSHRPGAHAQAPVDATGDALVHRAHEHRARPHHPEYAPAHGALDGPDPAGGPRQLVEAEGGQGAELAVAHERILS